MDGEWRYQGTGQVSTWAISALTMRVASANLLAYPVRDLYLRITTSLLAPHGDSPRQCLGRFALVGAYCWFLSLHLGCDQIQALPTLLDFPCFCCRYQQLVDVGLNIAELVHLEGQDIDSEASGSEVDGHELWEAAAALDLDDQHSGSEQDVSAADSGSSSSSRAPTAVASSSSRSSSSSTPRVHVGGIDVGAKQQDAVSSAATDVSARPASARTVQKLQDPKGSSVGGILDVLHGSKRSSGRDQVHKSKSTAHLAVSDPASAGSVTGASLRVASMGGLAPPALSTVRLAAEANRNLTGVEAREKGSVSGVVLRTYISAGGGMLIVAIIALLFAAEQGARVFTDTWLGFWASNNFHQGMWFYIGIYAASGIFYSLMTFSR